MELQWLLEAICPNYHSISDFRKENPKTSKQLFKLFVSFLKDAELIAGETIAIGGINLDDLPKLKESGVFGIAVSNLIIESYFDKNTLSFINKYFTF